MWVNLSISFQIKSLGAFPFYLIVLIIEEASIEVQWIKRERVEEAWEIIQGSKHTRKNQRMKKQRND